MGIPHLNISPKIENPSQADISGHNRFGLETKLLYNYVPKKDFGVVLGVNAGLQSWDYIIQGPYSAFGTHQDNGMLRYISRSSDYHYIGGTVGASYEGEYRNHKYYLEAGTTIRKYINNPEGELFGAAFNREKPYDPYDPNAGPPDFYSVVPSTSGKFFPNLYLNLSTPLTISDHSSIFLGITGSWSPTPIGKGKMEIYYNNVMYHGEFSPRLPYIGADFKYGYSF